MNRRELLRLVGAGSLPFIAGKWPNAFAQAPSATTQAAPRKYELLLKGGRVIDPSQGFNAPADVAIAGGRIAEIAKEIATGEADRTVPVAGQIVTPGLVDLHTHGFAGISHWGVDLDQYCLARGTTTAIDAGTSGSDSFEGFRRLVIEPSRTRILAFLNISRVGLIGQPGELIDTRMIDAASTWRVAKEQRRCHRRHQGALQRKLFRPERYCSRESLTQRRRSNRQATDDPCGQPPLPHGSDSRTGAPRRHRHACISQRRDRRCDWTRRSSLRLHPHCCKARHSFRCRPRERQLFLRRH